MKINGWNIYFYPLFADQRLKLRLEVRDLKSKLSNEDYIKHPTVKRYAATMRFIKDQIPQDPYAERFKLGGVLTQFKRAKGYGLDSRHRHFFKVMEVSTPRPVKAIFVLWLGYPRKAGDRDDCYSKFKQLVLASNFPATYEDLLESSEIP